MAAYARQAKDTELVQWATEIKVRAERRAGEMLNEGVARGELATRGRPRHDADKPFTVTDLGIDENQSKRWKGLARMSEENFETAIATAKDTAGQVTTAFILRAQSRAVQNGAFVWSIR